MNEKTITIGGKTAPGGKFNSHEEAKSVLDACHNDLLTVINCYK